MHSCRGRGLDQMTLALPRACFQGSKGPRKGSLSSPPPPPLLAVSCGLQRLKTVTRVPPSQTENVAGGHRWAARHREPWREVALPWQGCVSCRSSLPLGLTHLRRPCPADNDHRAEGGCGQCADAVLTVAPERGCGSAGTAPVTGAVLLTVVNVGPAAWGPRSSSWGVYLSNEAARFPTWKLRQNGKVIPEAFLGG